MIIYTAIFDGYDKLPEPVEINKDVEYICFSNTIKRNNYSAWKVINIDFPYDSTRKNRFVKINSHLFFPKDEIVIYIDPTFLIVKDFADKIDEWLDGKEISSRLHPSKRKSVYEEAEYLIVDKSHKLDSIDVVRKQMDFYRGEGYPSNHGLCEGGFLIRKNTENIKRFNEIWWEQVKTFSKRDQLSFMYSVWKSGIDINIVPREELDKYTMRCKYHK